MSQGNPFLRRQARQIDPAQLQRGQENHQALRTQYEHDQQRAQQRSLEMATRDRSPMNFTRVDTSAAVEGFAAYGELNQLLDEALGEIDQAMQRGRLAAQTSGATDDDLRRSTALRNRRGA